MSNILQMSYSLIVINITKNMFYPMTLIRTEITKNILERKIQTHYM